MRCNGAFARSLIGRFAQARAGIEAVFERARRSANARVIGTALASLGSVSIWQGRFEEADALADQALHLASSRGDQRFQAAVHGMRSRAKLAMGDAEGELIEAQRATMMAPPRSETGHVARGAKAMALLRLGRPEAALAASGAAVAALDEGRLRATAFDPFLRLCHTDVLHALGRREDADRALSVARRRLAAIAMRLPREFRRTYLTARPEHARILTLWQARRGGETRDAAEPLQWVNTAANG